MSETSPLFSFGIVSDIQYADLENRSKYRFRDVPPKLAECIETWNRHNLAFNIQLGDLIQGNGRHTHREFELIAQILDSSKAPLKHVIGNHCLELPLATLKKRLGFHETYHRFIIQNFRLLILNSMDVSIYSKPYNPEAYEQALAYLNQNPVVKEWSGGLGELQLNWLENELNEAEAQHQRVIVFNHLPIHEETTDVHHGILWHHKKIKQLLLKSEVVAAYFNGHYHLGGYAKEEHTHFITLEALVQAPELENAFGIVDVCKNHLKIKGFGGVTTRTLDI